MMKAVFNFFLGKVFFNVQTNNGAALLSKLKKFKIEEVAVNENSFKFKVAAKYEGKIRKLLINREYKIKRSASFGAVVQAFKKKTTFILAACACIVCACLLSSKIYVIKLSGVQEEYYSEVYNFVKQNRNLAEDESSLEKAILAEFDFISLASVKKEGAAIIVNTKQRAVSMQDASFVQITAPFNLIISSVSVVSGTLLYSVGDSVLAGSVLVDNYQLTANGNKYHISAKATIVVEKTYSVSVLYTSGKLVANYVNGVVEYIDEPTNFEENKDKLMQNTLDKALALAKNGEETKSSQVYVTKLGVDNYIIEAVVTVLAIIN